MDNAIQKKFKFDRIAQAHSFEGDFPEFTIREATREEYGEREAKLWELKKRCSSTENLIAEIQMIDIVMLLTDCNLTLTKTRRRIIHFDNRRVSSGDLGLSQKERQQIHEKIMEINPSLQGQMQRVAEYLRTVNSAPSNEQTEATVALSQQQKNGHFKDLAINKSLFAKNKRYLLSLLEEIKQDVFDSEGEIRLDFPPGAFAQIAIEYQNIIARSAPYFENIVFLLEKMIVKIRSEEDDGLFAGRSIYQVSDEYDVSKWKYIGVVEHGPSQLRVVAHKGDSSSQDLFNYWDTSIEDIIATLRTAILWYQRKEPKHRYTEEELDALDEDPSWMDDAMNTYNELSEYYDDD